MPSQARQTRGPRPAEKPLKRRLAARIAVGHIRRLTSEMADGLGEITFGVIRPRIARVGAVIDASIAIGRPGVGVIDGLSLLRPLSAIARRLRPAKRVAPSRLATAITT